MKTFTIEITLTDEKEIAENGVKFLGDTLPEIECLKCGDIVGVRVITTMLDFATLGDVLAEKTKGFCGRCRATASVVVA